MSASHDSLQERYGAPSRLGRLVAFGFIGAVIIALLVWLVWVIADQADPAVASQDLTKEILDDHTVTVTFRIKYGDGPVAATCTSRALADDGEEVGSTAIEPDPDEGPDYTITYPTTRRASSIEWLGCTTEGQRQSR